MSKTPEQVALDAVFEWNQSSPTISVRIVSALRSAGWLRDCPWSESASEERIARLTRERDEARQGEKVVCDLWKYWKSTAEGAQGRLQEAQAAAASPEVMRVVEAAKAEREYMRSHQARGSTYYGSHGALAEAVDALAASQQPKAQEPRYRVIHAPHWVSSFHWCVIRGAEPHDGFAQSYHFRQKDAEAECASLNAEAK